MKKLPSVNRLKKIYKLSKKSKKIKQEKENELADILKGNIDKFILIIGPCSADSLESVLEYNRRLASIEEKVKDKILIISRVYTSKPRTTGIGYKGIIHQPDPRKEENISLGIKAMREIHVKVIEKTHLITADEILYPEMYKYISDVLSYAVIGARSVENQEHRLLASAMNVPVGLKNPTSGNLSVMLNAITASQNKQVFPYNGYEIHSNGNNLTHAILRGSTDEEGNSHSNYDVNTLTKLHEMYVKKDYNNPSVIIDTNHSNSGKNYKKQIEITKYILENRKMNPDIKKMVKGLMIESYIEESSQEIGDNVFGKSITDPCLGWNDTEKLILDIYDNL